MFTDRIYRIALVVTLALPIYARAADTGPTTRPERPQRPGAGAGLRDPGALLQMQRQRLNELNLTDDQKKQLDAIYAAAEQDFKKALEESRDADPQARREKIGPVLMSLREKVAGVLTDEQKQKFRAMGPAGGGFGRPGGSGGGEMLGRLRENLDKLDLSADQKTKVSALMDDAQKKADALRAEMENGNADRQQLMEKGMQMREDMRSKLTEILTPDQLEKLRGMMPPPGQGQGGRPGRGGPTTRPAQ